MVDETPVYNVSIPREAINEFSYGWQPGGAFAGPDGVFEWMTTRAGRLTKHDNIGLVPDRWNICDRGMLAVYPSGASMRGLTGGWLCAVVARDGQGLFQPGVWSPDYARPPVRAPNGMVGIGENVGVDGCLKYENAGEAMAQAQIMLTRQAAKTGEQNRAFVVFVWVAVAVGVVLFAVLAG